MLFTKHKFVWELFEKDLFIVVASFFYFTAFDKAETRLIINNLNQHLLYTIITIDEIRIQLKIHLHTYERDKVNTPFRKSDQIMF